MRKSVSLLTAAALALSTVALAASPSLADTADSGMLGADPAPTGLRTTTTGNRTVTLAWDPVASSSRYTVKVAVAANPDNIPSPSLGSVTYINESAKVGNLTNGVDYSFQVSATVNAKLTDYSAPVYGAPTPGEVPSNLRVTDIGNGAVYLDFDASDRATGYKINTTIIDANGVPAPLGGAASVNTAASSATVTKLSNGVEYGFQVAAVVDGYNTDWSAPKVPAIPLAVPNKAATPAAGVVTGTSIQVKWTATAVAAPAEPVDFYQVAYGPSLDATPTLVRSDTISYTATGVSAGTEYAFKVRAHNPAGYGPWSLPLKVVAADKPGAVTNLSATRVSGGHSIDLTWTAPKFAGGAAVTKYVVAITPKVGTQVVEPAPATHATLNGLDSETDYKLSITAYTAAGAGGANTITSLAQSPQVEAEPVLATDGSVSWTFTAVDSVKLDYEAQATQLDRLATGARSGGKRLTDSQLTSRTTVTADSVSCTAGVCTATWKRFGDDIDGEAWLFRVRATDNVSAYSNWVTINPAPPVPVEQVFSAQQEKGGAWSLRYGADWAQRTTNRFLKASANGTAFQSSSMSLGKYPGTQTVTVQGLGGTAAHAYALPDGPTQTAITGGSVSEFTVDGHRYRMHTFSSDGVLDVEEVLTPVRVVLVGGSGDGGAHTGGPNGPGGGGASMVEGTLAVSDLPPGQWTVKVGIGGGKAAQGDPAGPTSLSLPKGQPTAGGASGPTPGVGSTGGYTSLTAHTGGPGRNWQGVGAGFRYTLTTTEEGWIGGGGAGGNRNNGQEGIDGGGNGGYGSNGIIGYGEMGTPGVRGGGSGGSGNDPIMSGQNWPKGTDGVAYFIYEIPS